MKKTIIIIQINRKMSSSTVYMEMKRKLIKTKETLVKTKETKLRKVAK